MNTIFISSHHVSFHRAATLIGRNPPLKLIINSSSLNQRTPNRSTGYLIVISFNGFGSICDKLITDLLLLIDSSSQRVFRKAIYNKNVL